MATDHCDPDLTARWRSPSDAPFGDYVEARAWRVLRHYPAGTWKDMVGQPCEEVSSRRYTGRVYGPLPRDPGTLESLSTTADLIETVRQGLRDEGGWPICYYGTAGAAIRELLRRLTAEQDTAHKGP